MDKKIHTAEAMIQMGTYLGKLVVVKQRIQKNYRALSLDERIRKERCSKEASLLNQAKKAGVRTPLVYKVDKEACVLVLEKLNGKTLEKVLQTHEKKNAGYCKRLGKAIAQLHEHAIIHGDLTTSNVMVLSNGEIAFVDFGLGSTNGKLENQAVDLLNLKKTLMAGNSRGVFYWNAIWNAYKKVGKQAARVEQQLRQVEERVRYAGN